MRLLKPSWVSHDGHPIFSVDIHPDGTRFATGGQGADAGRVVIWNMAPVVSEEDENNENIPKLLCQMDNHLACVNAVRWSNSGKLLASGGDDKVIMIWQLVGKSGGSVSSVFGSSGPVMNVEHWRCISSLRGHSGDVLDLAWSVNDIWLATSSVDNNIIIWNTHKWQEIVTVLKGHTSLVKGVVWDPIGKYIASQSDDKSLRVWRTYDWQPEAVVTEPFVECGGTTHILRLAWSPDGQYLVSAHAMNNSGPTAQIVERDGWKTNKDFVGHRKAITCVRFNPNILSNSTNNNKDKVQHFCCCAIGSRDRSLSVWLTCLKRPLVVIHDLFTSSVLDITWNQLGTQLLVCSWDGTVAYVDFSEEELGKSISSEEKAFLHQKYYGKSLLNHTNSSITNLIEDPELLKLQEELVTVKKEEEDAAKNDKIAKKSSPLPPSQENNASNKSSESSRPPTQFKGPIDKQIETRMPDGRRRITPLFIPLNSELNDVPAFGKRGGSGSMPVFSSSTESKSKIVIEKRDESQSSLPSSTASNTPPVQTNGQVSLPSLREAPSTPKEVGKPSIKDNYVPPDGGEVETKPPKDIVLDQEPAVSLIPVKRKNDVLALAAEKRPPEKRRPGRPPSQATTPTTHLPRTSPHRPSAFPSTAHHSPHQAHDKPHSEFAKHSGLHLPVLKIEKSFSIQLSKSKDGAGVKTLEAENNLLLAPGLQGHRLKCWEPSSGIIHWDLLFPSRIASVTTSKYMIGIICEDCTLTLLSPHGGRRLRPPLALSGPASRVVCHHQFLLVITSRGALNVWDFKQNKVIIKNEPLLPIMQNTASSSASTSPNSPLHIRNVKLTDKGLPVISLSSGKSYLYDTQLGAWLQLCSGDTALTQCCEFQSLAPPPPSHDNLPLASLQTQLHKAMKGGGSRTLNVGSNGRGLAQAGTLSFLESQLVAAETLHSPKEYQFWLLSTARYLAQEGMESRLRDICDSLLGPVVKSASTSGKHSQWDPEILGLKKRQLLKEILPIIIKNLRLQRLYTEYKEMLESLKDGL